jgi:hypothetical protein
VGSPFHFPNATSAEEKLHPRDDLFLKGLDDWAGVFKLQLGTATGAIVLIVHAIVDSHIRPSLAALLTLSALSFCASAVASLSALVYFSFGKARYWDSAHRSPHKDVYPVGAYDFGTGYRGFYSNGKLANTFFKAGVIFAVIFLIAYFFFSLKHPNGSLLSPEVMI